MNEEGYAAGSRSVLGRLLNGLRRRLGLLLLEWRRRREQAMLLRCRNSRDVFTLYYKRNVWGNRESASGPGSTVEATESLRTGLASLVEDLGVRRILDAPCGDYNWFRMVPRSGDIIYIGADIVKPLVRRNRKRYADTRTSFVCLDIARDRLPPVDLWLCRDCLFHLSNDDIFRVIANLLRSDIRYFLATSHPSCTCNSDIVTGSFRSLNLELPPFGLGRPVRWLEDPVEGQAPRKIGLWERAGLAELLGNRPEVVEAAGKLAG